jgi:hypothetical protein
MLRRKKLNLLKSKYKLIYIYKNKIKNLILKSMFNNRNITIIYRAYAYLHIINNKTINQKYHKICKFTGFRKNVNKLFSIGRHELNRKAILGELQNISVNS